MKTSRFNIWVNDYPNKSEHLLFNTRTQALIRVNQQLKEELDRVAGAPERQSAIAQARQIESNFEALKENGIIVEDREEEQAKLSDFFRQLQHESHTMTYEVTILTTYACNFGCVYCFEESVKDKVFLNKETSDLTVKWLIRRAQNKGFKRIHIVYYGGEPLLNIDPIYNISQRMHEWTEENGIDFTFSMITNGSLVTPELVERLLPPGLREIRISIDGDREAHDKKRPFSDGRRSFDIIIDNIREVIDKVDISISGNFDRENVHSISRFLDYLKKEELLHRLKRINFSPIVPRLGPKDNPGAIELGECLSFIDKDGLFDETVNIKNELMKRGIDINTGLTINACPLIMQDGGITIDPKGLIYKCNSLLGYPEFSVGNVKEDEFNERFGEFMKVDPWNRCPEDCPYVPMCQGGCRFFSYLENHNFTDLSCKKEYFDRIIPKLIKLEYDKRVKT
ncbi:MAG: radical SAM protein [Candidatus Omnitrophota bacterium]